jgi:hypothetical protein
MLVIAQVNHKDNYIKSTSKKNINIKVQSIGDTVSFSSKTVKLVNGFYV